MTIFLNVYMNFEKSIISDKNILNENREAIFLSRKQSWI